MVDVASHEMVAPGSSWFRNQHRSLSVTSRVVWRPVIKPAGEILVVRAAAEGGLSCWKKQWSSVEAKRSLSD